jgi:excisionase family DNA binding protein
MTKDNIPSEGVPGEKEWLSPAEIAAEFGFNVETVRRWIREKRLPASRPGSRAFIVNRADLMKLIAEKSTGPVSPSEASSNRAMRDEEDDAPQAIGNSISLAD